MASFYGNIKNNSRASFIFDRFYSSRTAMDQALKKNIDNNGAIQGDGIFINRYVMINYGYDSNGTYQMVPNDHVQQEGQIVNSTLIVTKDNYSDFYIIDSNGKYIQADKFYEPGWFSAGNHYYQKVNFINRWDNGHVENPYYRENRELDQQNYNAEYDLTVWMKIYTDNEEKYIMVGRLDIDAPGIELVVDAPSEGDFNGGPHFDLVQSSDSNYVYHMPKNWNFILNEYDPEKENTYITPQQQPGEDLDGYWNYEYDLDEKTYESEHEYPYYNKKGFDPKKQSHVNFEDDINLNSTKSGRKYPNHRYHEISLTANTYKRNWYYIKHDDDYVIAIGEFDPSQHYFIKTSEDTSSTFEEIVLNENLYRRDYYYIQVDPPDGDFNLDYEIGADGKNYIKSNDPFDINTKYYTKTLESEQLDTKRLDISLPSIGNAISDVYDSIYGKPTEDGLIGYTDSQTAGAYNSNKDNTHPNQCKINDPETGEEKFLSEEEIDDLYHDNSYPHNIPVYDTSGERRPFTENQLFDATNIDPYDNIKPSDPVSMAWGVYEIKKYLSELRFLADGVGIIGYTSENLLATYTLDNNGMYQISTDYYSLTEEQLDGLQPFNVETGFTIPVRKDRGIGLQSDWTLDENSAFGYIYHKPRILWSNPNLTNNSETIKTNTGESPETNYYAMHSIEYIYDNYKDNTLEQLFGMARNTSDWLNNSI